MTTAELAALDQATAHADHDAARATHALGRLIVLAFALTVALAPAAIAPGTWASAAGLAVGVALAARVLHVAIFKEHQ